MNLKEPSYSCSGYPGVDCSFLYTTYLNISDKTNTLQSFYGIVPIATFGS